MTDVERAYRGKVSMLKACFGAPEKGKPKPINSAADFDRMWG